MTIIGKFSYRAYDNVRTLQTGELDAESVNAAYGVLNQLGLIPVEIKPVRKGFVATIIERIDKNRAGDKWPSIFFRQLSTMLGVMNLRDALELLTTSTQDRTQRKILKAMLADVTTGKTLEQAMSNFSQIFSGTVTQLVLIGQESGRLQEIAAKLAEQLERSYKSSKKLQSAMYYPLFVICAAFIAISILISTVLPVFATFYEGQGSQLPLLTRLVMSGGLFVSEHFVTIIAAALMLIIGAMFGYHRSRSLRLIVDRVVLMIPFVGRLASQSTWMNFFGSLSFLIESGVRIDRAVEMSAAATTNEYIRAALKELHRSLESGGQFQCAIFPPECQGLITSGEASGTLPTMLQRCEMLCAFEVEELSNQLPVRAEIAGTLVAGVIVAMIVFSVMLPVLSMGI